MASGSRRFPASTTPHVVDLGGFQLRTLGGYGFDPQPLRRGLEEVGNQCLGAFEAVVAVRQQAHVAPGTHDAGRLAGSVVMIHLPRLAAVLADGAPTTSRRDKLAVLLAGHPKVLAQCGHTVL